MSVETRASSGKVTRRDFMFRLVRDTAFIISGMQGVDAIVSGAKFNGRNTKIADIEARLHPKKTTDQYMIYRPGVQNRYGFNYSVKQEAIPNPTPIPLSEEEKNQMLRDKSDLAKDAITLADNYYRGAKRMLEWAFVGSLIQGARLFFK